jgi:hypothetical protein
LLGDSLRNPGSAEGAADSFNGFTVLVGLHA